MYGNIYDDEKQFEKHMAFPKLLGERVQDFSWVCVHTITMKLPV